MAFDLSTAKPVSQQSASSGGFDLSTARPEQESIPGSELLSPKSQQLPPEKQRQLIDALQRQHSILPESSRPTGPTAAARRAQSFEKLQQENPALAEIISDLSPTQAAAIGFQQGLRTVARGAGKLVGQDLFPDVADESLNALQGVSQAAQAGKVAGEAAPFVAAAPASAGLRVTSQGAKIIPKASSTAGRVASSSAVGAAEGGTIAAGEDGGAAEIAAGALLGGALSALPDAAGSVSGRASRELPDDLVAQGEEILRVSGRDVSKAIDEAAPTQEQLFDRSSQLFSAANKSGVRFRPGFIDGFSQSVRRELEDGGLDAVNTPEASRALERLEMLTESGKPITFRDVDQVRATAQAAANSTNRTTQSLGVKFIERIDDMLNSVSPQMLEGGKDAAVRQVKTARKLWGRARKSQEIESAIGRAQNQASGFENGIRVQFRSILNNERKKKLFNPNEIAAMERVVQGTKKANLFKFLGRFGISEQQATSMLGASVGAGGGAALGSAVGGAAGAGIGAVLLPVIGQVSKGLAQRMTRGNAAFADRVIRAGNNADEIARAYLSSTPKNQRSAQELSQLLMRGDINLERISSGNRIAVEAAEIARAARRGDTLSSAATATAVPVVLSGDE